ncbi:hypothetical protein H072_6467 [Dactylellina haptotyla CBS 200.50]|uniref:Arsenite methyltransferase n=1 Tax=Dactylellina haptotyla (strain CBS 200.50) TaxID=1284197 RepID=S8A9Z7_DACHA|nr:hypothetical protein H072_6467 [Dactylellina haptotyla CBS 200.50]
MDPNTIYKHVERQYGSIARADNPKYSGTIAKAFGYSEEELSKIPKDANLGLSCGNPLAIAALREGETVIDLGSGAGFDVFLAAKKVGATGQAIGVDMNKDMLARARENLKKSEAKNITFVEAKITAIPLSDGIADCIISNCVINLVPEIEKLTVFKEMSRLLKQGGRVAISDILTRKTLPTSLKEDVELYTGCIAGASPVEAYKRFLNESGFADIMILDTESNLNVYIEAANLGADENGNTVACCKQQDNAASSLANEEDKTETRGSCCPGGSESKNGKPTRSRFVGLDLNEWVGSFKIFAVKA